MQALNWHHSDEWKCPGKDFMVMVRRHRSESPEYHQPFASERPHRWCVYAFIYPKHPHFAEIKGDDRYQESICGMPLHCGVSYFKRHWADKSNTAIQIGCDYNHWDDDRYTRMETKDDAASVFRDAEGLFKWLADRRTNGEEE